MADIGEEVERIKIEPQKIPREKPAPTPVKTRYVECRMFVDVNGTWKELGTAREVIIELNRALRDRRSR